MTKLPKSTSLSDGADPFRDFSLGECTKKRTLQKSHREVIFHLLAGNYLFLPSLPKMCISVGVVDVINHTKFGNDRSKECTITEG